MKQILDYLLTLDNNTAKKAVVKMVQNHLGLPHTEDDGGCTTKQPTGPGSTPNGDWECIDGAWVWIPDIGR